MKQFNCIDFKITEEQAKLICKYWNENYEELEDYEIASLLDRVIDELNEDIIEEEN